MSNYAKLWVVSVLGQWVFITQKYLYRAPVIESVRAQEQGIAKKRNKSKIIFGGQIKRSSLQ